MTAPRPHHPAGPYAGRRVHFIGAGGCGMSGLAEFVLIEGGVVSGSDAKASAATDRLVRLGPASTSATRPSILPLTSTRSSTARPSSPRTPRWPRPDAAACRS